uniref:Uncharacterized protein n=1 Tax=Rhabditophanes sp. KR3021 TaxID=114890 RepID=A0AC35UGN5_9BILA
MYVFIESQIALDALVQILQSREHLLSYVIGIDLMGVSTTNNQGWSNYLDTGSSYPLLDTERVDTKKMKDTEEDYEEDDYSDEDDESSIVIESGSSKIPKQDHIDPTNNTNNPSNSSKTVGKLVPDLLRTDLSPINSTSIMIIKVNNTKEVENNDSPSVLLMGSVDSSTQQTNTDLNPLPQSKDQEKIANINATPKSSDGYLTDLMGNIPNWITIFVLSLLCTFFISLFVVAIVTLVIVKCRANWKKIGSTSKQMEKEPVKSIIKPSIDEELEKNDREDNDGNVVSNQKKANCPGIRLKSNAYGVEDKLLVENESTTKV